MLKCLLRKENDKNMLNKFFSVVMHNITKLWDN